MLCITKGSLEDHPDKLWLVLTSLQDMGLHLNAFKSHFCAVATEYLGYIVMCAATCAEGTYNHQKEENMVLANCSKEDVIYPLTVKELAQA